MPKLHFVKKARKDNPVAVRGESYYWWKFAFGSKQFSKAAPSRSRLTQSDFFIRLYDLEDSFTASESAANLADQFEAFSSELEELRDEQEEKLENMPESLQAGPTGELLQERYDALEEWVNEIESLDTDYDEDSDESEEDFVNNVVEEFTSLFGGI